MSCPRVAVVGYALEKYSGVSPTFSEELGYRVARRAREHAGIERERIDSVHNSTMDLFDGVTISNGILQPAGGGYDRDCTRIQNGGLFAIISACASILSEASDVAIVSSVDAVDSDLLQISTFSSSPYFEQPLGMNYITSYALFSAAYQARRDITDQQVADIAAHNYKAGAANEYAHVQDGYSSDDVLASESVASPLRSRMLALNPSYGGAALVLASEKTARKIGAAPLSITGFGMSTFTDDLDDQLSMSAIRQAARTAYNRAGMENIGRDVSVVEINNPFALFELAAYPALGLCTEESAAESMDWSRGNPFESLRINDSGGTLCTNARNSGGLFRMIYAAMSLERNGTSKSNRAIVHDSDMSLGIAGSSHAVVVLERG